MQRIGSVRGWVGARIEQGEGQQIGLVRGWVVTAERVVTVGKAEEPGTTGVEVGVVVVAVGVVAAGRN